MEEVDRSASKPYIAARYDSRRLPSEFLLGNGLEYGGYINRPLDKDREYNIFLRAYSVDKVTCEGRRKTMPFF